MSIAPFGNDPAKIERYQAFWGRADATRPLVGFTTRGWFPLERACPWCLEPSPVGAGGGAAALPCGTGRCCPAAALGLIGPLVLLHL